MPIRIAILSLKQILEILFCLKRFGKKSGDSFSSSFKRFGPVGRSCVWERAEEDVCVCAYENTTKVLVSFIIFPRKIDRK